MLRLGLRWLLLPMFAFLVHPLPHAAVAGAKALSADLALVPADGVAFAHLRLGDLWKGEYLKDWRETIDKAGAQSLAAFDSRFFPTPSSLDRITLVVPELAPEPVVILATSKVIDKASFLKYTVPDATPKKIAAGKTLYVYARKNLEFFFADDKTLLVGPSGAVQKLLGLPRAAGGNLTEAIQLANSGRAAVLGVNVEAFPQLLVGLMLKDVPPPMRALLDPVLKAKLATLSLDLRNEGQLDLRLSFADAGQTADADKAAREGIKLARTFVAKGRDELNKKVRGKPGSLQELPEAAASLFTLGMLNRVDEYLAGGPIRRDRLSLLASAKIPQGGQAVFMSTAVAAGLMVPAVQKVRDAGDRIQSMNNLKQIALAMHTYLDTYKMFPAAAICDKKGKPLLSWRVAILPFIEQNDLYKRFKLDEPWDSEHNKKLIPLMPSVYVLPAAPPVPGETHYRAFVGNGAAFDLTKGATIADFTDGRSNTILCVEAGQSVPWTKPEDLAYDAKTPLPKFANFYGTGVFHVAFCDETVRQLRSNISEATMRALITRAAGDTPGKDFDD